VQDGLSGKSNCECVRRRCKNVPDGQSNSVRGKTFSAVVSNASPLSSHFVKIFHFLIFRKCAYLPPSRLIEEGRTRGRHETRGGDAVGVSSRSVVFNGRADERLDAHGQGVWFWRPGAGAKWVAMLTRRAHDGGKKAGPRGDHAAAVKPFAQGRPGADSIGRRNTLDLEGCDEHSKEAINTGSAGIAGTTACCGAC
jgi:hypothetical protein